MMELRRFLLWQQRMQEQNPVAENGNGLEIVKRNGEGEEFLFCDEL